MGFAEKKVKLFQIVTEADDEMTGKLIEFAKHLKADSSKFAKKDLDILLEAAPAYIRSLKQK